MMQDVQEVKPLHSPLLELRNNVGRKIADAVSELPPSMRKEYEEMLEGWDALPQLPLRACYLVTDLSDPVQAARLEKTLQDRGCKKVSQENTHWTPDGKLMHYVALNVTDKLYYTLRPEESPLYEKPTRPKYIVVRRRRSLANRWWLRLRWWWHGKRV